MRACQQRSLRILCALGPPGFALLLLCTACAPRAAGPEQTLRRFGALLADGRAADAWRLMSPAYREQCDLDCFQRLVDRHREELRRAFQGLRAGTAQTELRQEVVLAPGSTLTLVQRPGQPWLLSGDPLDFYPQSTPAEALVSFIRALEGQRYAVALRFVPARLRQQITPERLRERWEGPQRQALQAQLAAVKRHLKEPFLIEGTEARLPVGERHEARLVLEEGRWCVLQLQ